MVRLSALGALLPLGVACSSVGGPSPTARPTPAREPASLAVLSEERAVLDAFAAGALTVRTVGGSKHESTLGRLLPARAFIVAPGPVSGGFGQGADVLFVPSGLGVIQVCSRPGNVPGRTAYTVFLDGRKVSDADAVAPVYYLVGPSHFVIAYDTRTRDVLEKGLNLTPARPADLC